MTDPQQNESMEIEHKSHYIIIPTRLIHLYQKKLTATNAGQFSFKLFNTDKMLFHRA